MKFTSRKYSPEERKVLDRLRALPWSARFHRTVDNPMAPGGKVDMYLLIDDDTGEGLVSVATPHGQGFIAEWIGICCANPWFVKEQQSDQMVEMSQAMNHALRQFADADGSLNGYDVSMATLVLFEAYMTALPKDARNELAERFQTITNGMRAQ